MPKNTLARRRIRKIMWDKTSKRYVSEELIERSDETLTSEKSAESRDDSENKTAIKLNS